MKTPRILALSIAAQLVTLITSHAQTWDGAGVGGGSLNWSVANNWNPNAVPLNNGTANIIFAGLIDNNPGPNLDANWSVNSVTFNNTAGAFVLQSTGGFTLTVGAGGIVNQDTQTMTFAHAVAMSGFQTINAAAGGLTFTSTLSLGGGVAGGAIEGAFPVAITNGGSITGISVDVGVGVNGTLVVDGNTSSSNFGSGASESEFGGSGATGRGTFSNGSFNTFLGDVDIGVDGAGGVGIVNVLTGADVGISGDLRIGSDGTVGSSGTLTVNGVGSSSSSHALTLGAAGVSTGTLNVQNLGVFNGGFGGTPITVGATGTIADYRRALHRGWQHDAERADDSRHDRGLRARRRQNADGAEWRRCHDHREFLQHQCLDHHGHRRWLDVFDHLESFGQQRKHLECVRRS
jgi:hypothetical protein